MIAGLADMGKLGFCYERHHLVGSPLNIIIAVAVTGYEIRVVVMGTGL